MAKLDLDLVNYLDEDGSLDPQVIADLARDLNVTYDPRDLDVEVEPGAVLLALVVTFSGPREALVNLIDRYVGPEYDNDPELDPRPELLREIKNASVSSRERQWTGLDEAANRAIDDFFGGMGPDGK